MKKNIQTITLVLALVIVIYTAWTFLTTENHASIDGEWRIETEVSASAGVSNENMEFSWKLIIIQDKRKLTGTGELFAWNESDIKEEDRTRLKLNGTISGNKFLIGYSEWGKLRTAAGTFGGEVNENSLIGTFSESGTDTILKIIGKKVDD